jgi:uncharacterized protein (TIRG00374 family)
MLSRPDDATTADHKGDEPPVMPPTLQAVHFGLLRTVLSWLFGLAALSALIVAVAQHGSLAGILDAARATSPRVLVLACAAQVATYVCAAGVWWCVLRTAGHAGKLRRLMRLGVAKVFTDQLLPSSGVSGNILVVAALLRRQVPPPIVMAALLVGMTSFYAAYLAAAVAAALLLWLHDRQSPALLGLLAVFVVLTIVFPSLVFWARRQMAHQLPGWAARMPLIAMLLRAMAEAPSGLLRNPALLAESIGLQIMVFVLDAMTLWLVLQNGEYPPAFWIAFVSLIVASVVATLGPIPAGLGSFEGGAVVMLRLLDVPLESALAAVLLFRGLTFWLPMVPGLWLAHRELHHVPGTANHASRPVSAGDPRQDHESRCAGKAG